jgi:hypothetical protein
MIAGQPFKAGVVFPQEGDPYVEKSFSPLNSGVRTEYDVCEEPEIGGRMRGFQPVEKFPCDKLRVY